MKVWKTKTLNNTKSTKNTKKALKESKLKRLQKWPRKAKNQKVGLIRR